MTKEEFEEIMGAGYGPYYYLDYEKNRVCLDGDLLIDQLKAILDVMENGFIDQKGNKNMK